MQDEQNKTEADVQPSADLSEIINRLTLATPKPRNKDSQEPYLIQCEVNGMYNVLLRKDFGENNHDDKDHWNLEVQTKGRGRTVFDLHIYLNPDGTMKKLELEHIRILKPSGRFSKVKEKLGGIYGIKSGQ